jgi:Zn-dependent protease with chaperone function
MIETGQVEWQGFYFDGRTASRRPAVIRLSPGAVEIELADGRKIRWPYEEVLETQGFYGNEPARLERRESAEAILVADRTFIAALRRASPLVRRRLHSPILHRHRFLFALSAGAGAVAIAAVLYLWGIPASSALVARWVPVAWEERLGEAAIDYLAPAQDRCLDPIRSAKIQEIVEALLAPFPDVPYRVRVLVTNNLSVNALAIPGGFVLVFRGLLDRTRSAEEFAGVLAHELQHVLKRHVTRALVQNASLRLVLAGVAGDISQAMGVGVQSARTLGALRYTRRSEEEADNEGMRMLLSAGIEPAGMIRFFRELEKVEKTAALFPSYLSTHPDADDRIERLTALAEKGPGRYRKLMPDYNWEDIKKMCFTIPRLRQGG